MSFMLTVVVYAVFIAVAWSLFDLRSLGHIEWYRYPPVYFVGAAAVQTAAYVAPLFWNCAQKSGAARRAAPLETF